MQELEKWIAENMIYADVSTTRTESVVRVDDLRALLSRFVMCNAEPVAWMTRTETVGPGWGKEHYGKLPVQSLNPLTYSHHPLYAPASPMGNADISPKGEAGTMRIVAIQGAAEEYARQGNAELDNELWAKFGKEGGG